MLNGEVHTWFMTEEERLAYIKKHPILATEKPKGSTFVNTSFEMTDLPNKNKKKNK